MAKINLLSSKIYNRIAAGEVIERPFSVVKELVENSIDAGAKNIVIDIENGGLSRITITDDGCGIEKSELKKALLPHATSKISSLKDLDNIVSLGFRGEALASVASISKISIHSKSAESENAAEIYAEGGEIGNVTDNAQYIEGTEITVRSLFYNTPVRARFLKTERSEESEISSTVARFIMGNENIAFKYVADGKVLLQSFGDGLESAVVSVYGASVIGNCYNIDTERNGIKITGYVGKPSFTKSNRSYQTVFINGRYVVNQTVASSIVNAYAPYLMKRQYPFYVIKILLPYDSVDVNVHPNKTDVRFINNQVVYGTLYSVISKTLSAVNEPANLSENIDKKQTENNVNYVKHNIPEEAYKFDKLIFADSGNYEKELIKNKLKEQNISNVDIFEENKAYIKKLEEEQAKNSEKKLSDTLFEKIESPVIPVQDEIKTPVNLKVIGQALKTYIILEDGKDIYLLDQHAAHERLLYDEFIANIEKKEVAMQPLLVPYVLSVNGMESEFVNKKLSILTEMGFEIEEFGLNTFKISAIPVILGDMSITKFFDELLSDLNELKGITITSVLKDKIAQKACKSAIKSGNDMSTNEIAVLMERINGNLGLKCPHGRPVIVKISRTEIDKWFKRII